MNLGALARGKRHFEQLSASGYEPSSLTLPALLQGRNSRMTIRPFKSISVVSLRNRYCRAERKSGRMRRPMKVWQSILAAFKSPRVSQAKLNQLQAEAKEFFDKLTATGKISAPDTPVMMGPDETALLDEPSKLIEARATRVYAGGGTRVKGIYIGGGQSSSVQSLKQLDSGTLTLTTKRLVFTGSMESRVVNNKDVVSVEPLPDAIEISTGKKAKRQVYLVRNPIIWATLIRTVIKGGISATAAKPVAHPNADIRFSCPRCGQHLCVEERGAGMAVNCPGCDEQIEIPPPLPTTL